MGLFSFPGSFSSHGQERATAITHSQLEQPGPGLTTTGEVLQVLLLIQFTDEDVEAHIG